MEPWHGMFVGNKGIICGNIKRGQKITITDIRNPCRKTKCKDKKEGKCTGVSYKVKEYKNRDGAYICSNAITLTKGNFTLDYILGLTHDPFD